ncbi:agmatinase [Siminovitchia fortis]|uniref:Agmatinase n=2 Tax=Siminovitchia fortis TaxID=254758 RepID=A0A451GBY6_9BACI|nr:agmatinase [Siminovitchia fortis]RWR12631.1 agmatinase [Siminovitchia fortis]WHY83802.1 agmatinase [Siminovitchia fortis]
MRLPSERENPKVAILGMPFDTAASYRAGARFGPQAIRQASLTLSPQNELLKVSPFEDTQAIDMGDLPVITQNIHKSYDIMEKAMLELMKKNIIPIGLGGDHSITLASLRAAAKVYGPVALLQFDSHTDTWDTYMDEKYWHGSPFIRAHEEGLVQPDKVIQIGMRGWDIDSSLELGYNVVTQDELFNRGIDDVVQQVKDIIGNTPCFLTFDIDFVDPAYAPGTGTPEVGGFSSHETLKMVRSLTDMNFIGFDLVEVLPSFDPTQITALLAATIVHNFGSLAAVQLNQDKAK